MSDGPILFLHIRRAGNVGDLWSSPGHYLRFGDRETVFRDVRAYLRTPGKVKPLAVIAGGGAWKKDLARVRRLPALRGIPKIAWGVGITYRHRQGPIGPNDHTRRSVGWNLYGHRDYGIKGRWVPCASCLHPAWEKHYRIEHEVVYFGHDALMPLNFARGLGPHLTNRSDDIEEVAAFLGSGRVVVTSSYHGAYWARLLGRIAALIPRGAKFWHLPPPIKEDWRPLPFHEHRELNRAFHADVMELLGEVAV